MACAEHPQPGWLVISVAGPRCRDWNAEWAESADGAERGPNAESTIPSQAWIASIA